jgi:ABC-2 type transport system ATP-binding protein
MLPTSGVVKVAGYDISRRPAAARAQIGLVLSEERSFFWRLSGQANLEFFGALQRLSRPVVRQRAEEALAAVGLSDVAGRRVDRYSTGMRARLSIARSLIGHPSVLLLDEPTRSLDPVAGREVRTMVKDLAIKRHAAVLYTTHDLHEAAAIASKTMILVRGRIARWLPEGTNAAQLEEALVAAAGSADIDISTPSEIELIIEPEVMRRP